MNRQPIGCLFPFWPDLFAMTDAVSRELDLAQATVMVQALLDRLRRHSAQPGQVQCIETHISWVLLADDLAWKIKKPLRLDFLDFGTRALRQACCEEELRINRRTAPALYLDVVPITGTPQAPELGGNGPLLDHAVRMRRFPQDQLLSRLVQQGGLDISLMDALARQIAALHAQADRATPGHAHGQPQAIQHAVADNFVTLRHVLPRGAGREQLRTLLRWTRQQQRRLQPRFVQRLAEGQVREGHGDMHLGNLMLHEGQPLLFDAIEFDPALRWIDVMADIAFLVMDLLHRQRPDLAWRVLNGWLEQTGDYAGLELLPYFLVYRALVRAKVASLRLGQAQGEVRVQAQAELQGYLALAVQCTQPRSRHLWITMGLSGSGKSSQTQGLIARTGTIRLRADVERKRLFGLAPEASSRTIAEDIYTPEASRRTFERLGQLALRVLAAGFPVLVDATFIRRELRAQFRELAQQAGVPFCILAFEAPAAVLRQRIRQRLEQGGDASEADVQVLESQLQALEPLGPEEQDHALHIDSTAPVDWDDVLDAGGGLTVLVPPRL